MYYFSRRTWARLESPLFALRVLGAMQWQRSSRRYTRALDTLRRIAPRSLAELTTASLVDSVILGNYQQGGSLILEVHGSTRAGVDDRLHGSRVQLVLIDAVVEEVPPNGSLIVQEEWSVVRLPTSGERARFRLTALCTRGHLAIECEDAEVLNGELAPRSEIIMCGPARAEVSAV